MTPATWSTSDLEPDDTGSLGRPQPALVSLHFLRAALGRRRIALVLAALLGVLVAGGYLLVVPPVQRATVTLALAHDPQADPERAMATDLSLSTTRAVAQQVITTLQLSLTPEDLLETVVATPTTSDILTVTLEAPTGAESVRRLSVYADGYLSFRAEQLSAQSDLLVKGMNKRIDVLAELVDDLTEQIDELADSAADSAESELSDAVTRRAKIGAQIDVLQQSVQDAELRTTAVVAGSRVIDTPAVVPHTRVRTIALALASGLVGGTVGGAGLILFLAITSTRLRRRVDVVTALGVPVIASVGRLAPLPARWRRLPGLRGRDARRADDRQRLARVIESFVPAAGRGGGLVVGCVESAAEIRYGLVAAALNLQARPATVRLVDLTADGGLAVALKALLPAEEGIRITLSRPRTIPALALDLSDLDTFGPEPGEPWAWGTNDVFLVLTDLTPSDGAEYLRSWSRRVVVAVTAGKSTAERLRTAGETIRAAGLELVGAILVRADAKDDSSGHPPRTTSAPVRDQW